MGQWTYFADGNQALVRLPGPGMSENDAERYFGKGEWFARNEYCGSWSEDLPRGYREITPDEMPGIADHIDAMPGGVFRDRSRFWEDQGHRWSIASARSRANHLTAETGPDSSHWTVQSYYEDVDELKRLRVFLKESPPAR